MSIPITIDPLYGRIEYPSWLSSIKDASAVRRMMFIRQLGLNCYVDFPSAMHTRFNHALGVMYLAGRLTDILKKKITDNKVKEILETNKNNLMVAGFLHDVGHGPYSHAVDYVIEKVTGKTHTQIATEILDLEEIKKIETQHGISLDTVGEIITGQHNLDFIYTIIDGQIDVDKLDYLLRDAHYIGLHYSFDVEHFIDCYTVLGYNDGIEKSKLGLENTQQARITAELFILIWKSMYELVYYSGKTRIAEKMLEKAVLSAIENCEEIKEHFLNVNKFIELDDEDLFNYLKNDGGDFASTIVSKIKKNSLYEQIGNETLFKYNTELYSKEFSNALLSKNYADLANNITKKMCNKLEINEYDVIFDIIKWRVPKRIDFNDFKQTGEPYTLEEKSDFIRYIQPKDWIKIYKNSDLKMKSEKILKVKDELIKNWK